MHIAKSFGKTLAHHGFRWVRERRLIRSCIVAVLLISAYFQAVRIITVYIPDTFDNFFALNPGYEQYHHSISAAHAIFMRVDEMMNVVNINVIDFIVFWHWIPTLVALFAFTATIYLVIQHCRSDDKVISSHTHL